MQPEEVRDDTALRLALAQSVVLRNTDIPPCQWPQDVPCQNRGHGLTLDGALFVCLPHFNYYHRA